MPSLGNQLYHIVRQGRTSLFDQGELAQLTYGAFEIASSALNERTDDSVEVTFPVGYRPDKTAIPSTRTYARAQLQEKYRYLAVHQLTVNALVQLVTIVETILGDIVRSVVAKYPQKLGAKRTVPIQAVLESTSLEEVHIRATDALLNELSYKSPSEFAEAVEQLLSVNLKECPAFHRYIEVKATRDIFVHNRGVANDVYIRKSGSHARVNAGQVLPADLQYFLESYEYCLQIVDWLELELHGRWHSSDREDALIESAIQAAMPDAAPEPPTNDGA